MYGKKLSNLLAIAFILALASCQEKEKEQQVDKNKTITMVSLLKEMMDRDAIAKFPQNNFRLKQESSYNRASKSPKDSVGWFTNKDFNIKPKEGKRIKQCPRRQFYSYR